MFNGESFATHTLGGKARGLPVVSKAFGIPKIDFVENGIAISKWQCQ